MVGVLQLLNPVGKEAFSEDDTRRMQLFAGPLAHALDNARLYAAQQRMYVETVTALAEAVEKRDPYTGGHLRRVVAYSLLLGRELGLDTETLESLALGATLHDIGKIGVPDQVLLKPSRLDDAERRSSCGATPSTARRSCRGSIPCARSCRSSATTTSGSTAAAIPTASSETRSRSPPGSSPSPTPSTP